MKKQDLAQWNLPDSPGVYFFHDKEGDILYIGKATSLKSRVASYFSPDVITTRGLRIVTMVTIAHKVTFRTTDSVLEALLLESKLIKKHNPPYNAKEKDNKSFNCVVVTKEKFPRVLSMRIRDFEKRFAKKDALAVYGPFASLSQLKNALKIIRKMFPFRDTCEVNQGKPCFNAQIHLCPGVCVGAVSEKEYKGTIANIRKMLEGKFAEVKRMLKNEMNISVKKQEFEKAAHARNVLFALDHIRDISLIQEDDIMSFKKIDFRIESYDIAHISGTSRVGVMCVIEGKDRAKNEYRKFKLAEKINDDYEGLRQVLSRRFNHREWRYPDLIVIDGGKAHKETAEKVLAALSLQIPCVAVVKDERHKPKDILGDKVHIEAHKKEILLANAEAHRFAIGYHKHLRRKII